MTTAQALRPGSVLRNNTYRIERILGQGGFGITYLATDLTLDRTVAIKEFFPKEYCDRDCDTSHITLGTQSSSDLIDQLKVKFIKEARNIAKFDNPGIIKIYAAFEENNTAYYVMDYIEGLSLGDIVDRFGPIPADRALGYIAKVGNALSYVHEKSINHLDVKPANIMVRLSDETPILIDFGLSKRYDSAGSQTSTSPTGISYGYAPIEQYNMGGVKAFSPQTDLYSLGATLYFLLTGQIPPEAPMLAEAPLSFPPGVPEALQPSIVKAMSYARYQRHGSVQEFVEELMDHYEDVKGLPPAQAYVQETKLTGAKPVHEKPKKVAPAPSPAPAPQQPSVPRPDEETPVMGVPYIASPSANSGNGGNSQPPVPQQTVETPSYVVADEQPAFEHYPEKKSNKLPVIIGSLVGLVILGILIVCFTIGSKGDSAEQEKSIVELSETEAEKNVTDMPYNTVFGECSYTGEVNADRIPNGQGTATWKTGVARSYSGEWKDGVMDGECTYTDADGGVFKGTFVNNEYSKGRYTVKETGQYFEGEFKNGLPLLEKGSWYNKDGSKF